MRRAVTLAAAVALISCDGARPERWLATVYPDAGNLIVYENAGEYADFETCRAAALARLRALGAESSGSYECGLNCERDETVDAWICESTDA